MSDPGPLRFKPDAGLLAELYEKHGPAVYARCRYLLHDDDAAKDALQEVFAKGLRALLSAAPAEAQEVAVLYFVDELTQAEIAQATGRSMPTVRKRLREFLAAARAALAEALPGIELPEGDEP